MRTPDYITHKLTGMKAYLLLAVSITLLLGANDICAQQTKVKKEPDKLKTKTESNEGKEAKVKVEEDKIMIKGEGVGKDLVYPYTAEYSSQFVPGSPTHARLVLEMWRAWESNTLNQYRDALADSVVLELSNGEVYSGKDKVIAALKQFRDSLAATKVTMEAWMPYKSMDRDEDLVAIWAREEDTDKNGKVTNTRYHEVWMLDKNGKVAAVRQYSAQMPR